MMRFLLKERNKDFKGQRVVWLEIEKNKAEIIRGLKSGQKYYVKARQYNYDFSTKLWLGKWSKVKTITP